MRKFVIPYSSKLKGQPEIELEDVWNFWTVLAEAGKNKHGKRLVKCQCVCGKIKIVSAPDIRLGRVKCCGCIKSSPWNENRRIASEAVRAANQLYANYRGSAKRKNHEFSLSKQQLIDLTQKDCFYCGSPPSTPVRVASLASHKKLGRADESKWFVKTEYVYNGIDRRDNALGYTPDNCIPCCRICNRSKMDLSLKEFFEWIIRVRENLQQRHTNDTWRHPAFTVFSGDPQFRVQHMGCRTGIRLTTQAV